MNMQPYLRVLVRPHAARRPVVVLSRVRVIRNWPVQRAVHRHQRAARHVGAVRLRVDVLVRNLVVASFNVHIFLATLAT